MKLLLDCTPWASLEEIDTSLTVTGRWPRHLPVYKPCRFSCVVRTMINIYPNHQLLDKSIQPLVLVESQSLQYISALWMALDIYPYNNHPAWAPSSPCVINTTWWLAGWLHALLIIDQGSTPKVPSLVVIKYTNPPTRRTRTTFTNISSTPSCLVNIQWQCNIYTH